MRVVLQKSVSNLGFVGEVVNVAPGYFRNFLGPRGLAEIADAGHVRQMEHKKKVINARVAQEKVLAEKLKERIEAVRLTLAHAAGKDKLFGAVTAQEIALSLKDQGFDVDRRLITMENPIKTLGEHAVGIRLHPEVTATVSLAVEKKEEAKKKKTTRVHEDASP